MRTFMLGSWNSIVISAEYILKHGTSIPENARSFVIGAYNSPCDSFPQSSVLRTSINLSLHHRPLSLSDFWLPDHTWNYVAGFFGHFLGSEGTAIMTTPKFLFLLFIVLITLFLSYRIILSKKIKIVSPLLYEIWDSCCCETYKRINRHWIK